MENLRKYNPIAYEAVKKSKEYEDEASLVLFLHEKGYDVFTIPRLYVPEITLLIDGEKKKNYEIERKRRSK